MAPAPAEPILLARHGGNGVRGLVTAAIIAAFLAHPGTSAAQTVSYPYLPDRTQSGPSFSHSWQNDPRDARGGGKSSALPSTPIPDRYPTARAKNQFTSEAEARSNCGTDQVVWVDMRSHVYHASGSRAYGIAVNGSFMCRAQARRTPSLRAANDPSAARGNRGTTQY
jgi:hypothetical protein